jgi:TnpA family transposase
MAWLIAKNALKDTLNQVLDNENLARHARLLKDGGSDHQPDLCFSTTYKNHWTSNVIMVKDNFEKELYKILSLLKDIDMKVNHIIERLKSSYTYLNSLDAKNSR